MTGYTSGKHHADPRPWVWRNEVNPRDPSNGHRMAHWSVDHDSFEPRPEYDNHNPILVDFRRIMSADDSRDGPGLAAWWIKHWEAVAYFEAPAHAAHARRVLAKLAAS